MAARLQVTSRDIKFHKTSHKLALLRHISASNRSVHSIIHGKHQTNLQSFIHSDSGAVTVDWVVLTAALVGLGLATTAVVSGGVSALSNDMLDQLVNQRIITEFAAAITGMDWANYDYLAAQHGASRGTDTAGRGWAEPTYAERSDPSLLNEAEPIAQYDTNYAFATTQSPTSTETQTHTDYIAIQQQIMIERGPEIPVGNDPASIVRDRFS